MRKIVIITGMTASGKSGLAIDIAKKYNGEIISADSVQIYRGLDIGSAKEPIQSRENIPHHLIDIVDTLNNYNVGLFIEDCAKAIEDILSKGKLPIIVGGTGLYIKALMEGYTLGGAEKHQEFRLKYQEIAKTRGNLAVWEELNRLNSNLAKTVHYNNVKRVIRYLEIETFGQDIAENTVSILKDYDVFAIGIISDRELIYNRINKRVDLMLENGLENEVRSLISNGATRDTQAMNSIGYKEWFDYFDGVEDKETTINLIKQHTRNYCKRQLTFMKTIKNLELLDLSTAKRKIEDFLNDRTK